MNYDKLFTPGKIGSLTLKNRFVMGAMGVGFAKLGGTPTERTKAYYEARAKGGYALIITEVTRVQDSEFCTPFEPSLGDDKHIPASGGLRCGQYSGADHIGTDHAAISLAMRTHTC